MGMLPWDQRAMYASQQKHLRAELKRIEKGIATTARLHGWFGESKRLAELQQFKADALAIYSQVLDLQQMLQTTRSKTLEDRREDRARKRVLKPKLR